jgi:Uma2 family endonuclease
LILELLLNELARGSLILRDRVFEQLCANNPETRFETTPEGKLIVMSPTGSESERRNANLVYQVQLLISILYYEVSKTF